MLALLSGLFSALFSTTSAYYLAIKAVIVTLMMVVLPILLKNFFTWIVSGVLAVIAGSPLGTASPTIVSLTGLAGYLGSSLGIPAAVAVILSAVATRFTLKLIPFVRT
jgi:hypothetical protein